MERIQEVSNRHRARSRRLLEWGGVQRSSRRARSLRRDFKSSSLPLCAFDRKLRGDRKVQRSISLTCRITSTFPAHSEINHSTRRELPELAAQRISSHLQMELQPSQFIVIGDTPDDIACAHHFGARSVAVDTGHMYSVDELRSCEPDAVLPDLSNTEQFMRTLEKL